MSQQEFENYLTLLTRLLKVAPAQREQLAQEFRAHLEDRLDELLASGMAHEKAVQLAIGEFGDAAVLAAELAQVAQRGRRRLLMRMSYASVAALALVGLLVFALWPEGRRVQGPQQAVAQGEEDGAAAKAAQPNKVPDELALADKKIQAALDQMVQFDFIDTPLKDVADFLAEKYKINVVLAANTLSDAGTTPDTPITSALRGITLRSALRLTLGEKNLTYVIRDEVLQITTQEDADSQLITRVYDCRELLAMKDPPGSGRTKPSPAAPGGGFGGGDSRAARGGGGFFAVQSEPAGKTASPGDGAPGNQPEKKEARKEDGNEKETGERPAEAPEETSADRLIKLITTTVHPDSWDEVGGPGSVAEYKGLLAVSQTQEVHEKVERLLNMLHESAGLKERQVKVVE